MPPLCRSVLPPALLLRPTAAALLAAALACCGDQEHAPPGEGGQPAAEPLRIAVMMPPSETGGMSWALENVNAAGVAGRSLALDCYDPSGQDLVALGQQIADDGRYVAAIAPAGSAALGQVAQLFVDAKKPLLSTTSSADELLRAYGGKGYIWRTRESDIAQTELLLRFARDEGAHRLTLLASTEVGGSTFSSWFGFFARELGFAQADVAVVPLGDGPACAPALEQALAAAPEMLFVAAESPEQLDCVARQLPPPGPSRPRVVIADTGFDPHALRSQGAASQLEGFVGAGPEAFEQALRARFGAAAPLPLRGASEYDAVLLLAYGLEVSRGKGGSALAGALKQVADGDEQGPQGWDRDGVAASLAALRGGQRPALQGATGALKFEPESYMDLASSTLAHWTMQDAGPTLDRRYWTGDPVFLASQGATSAQAPQADASAWTPTTERADTWAVVAALSSDWPNYRHQADALQQYRLLRDRGVDDDHIVLVLADDIAASPSNPLPGQVRNEPAGADLRAGAQIDYRLALTAADLASVVAGRASERTPTVIAPTASSNVYVYLVGHGGVGGIAVNATTSSAGVEGKGDMVSPSLLRQALCSLRAEQRLRRALVVVESCYGGAFGEAAHGGIEQGCDDASSLDGVLLLTSATSGEVSLAGGYDAALRVWVNDSFSRRLAEGLQGAAGVSLGDLFVDAYRHTTGSHPSLYNASHAGPLTAIAMSEFFAP